MHQLVTVTSTTVLTMAAPSLTLSRAGAINADTGTWDKDNALFLKVFPAKC